MQFRIVQVIQDIGIIEEPIDLGFLDGRSGSVVEAGENHPAADLPAAQIPENGVHVMDGSLRLFDGRQMFPEHDETLLDQILRPVRI